MEQPAQTIQPAMGFTSAAQTAYAALTYLPAAAAYATSTYPPAAAVTGAPASRTIPPPFTVPLPHPLAYPQVPQFHHHQQQQLLQELWSNQIRDIEQTTDYKNHSLPLARIKKIMKADEDVRMISSEAPVIFAKACEIFILELTLRSWIHTEENKRRTLQKNDIAGAISRTDMFDFLVDIVPRDEVKEEGAGIPRAVGVTGEQMPYYHMPPHADPAAASAAAAAAGYGLQHLRLTAYMLQAQAQAQDQDQAQAQAQVQAIPEATTGAAQSQVQVIPEATTGAAAASSDA